MFVFLVALSGYCDDIVLFGVIKIKFWIFCEQFAMIGVEFFPDELEIVHNGNSAFLDLYDIVAVDCRFEGVGNPVLFVIFGHYEFELVVASFQQQLMAEEERSPAHQMLAFPVVPRTHQMHRTTFTVFVSETHKARFFPNNLLLNVYFLLVKSFLFHHVNF